MQLVRRNSRSFLPKASAVRGDRGERRPVRVLITGASSGLGAGMAKVFGSRGCDLVLTARRTERLAEIRDEILRKSPEARVLVQELDVTDRDAVHEVFNRAADEFCGLDRVVVNAGVGKGRVLGSGRATANRDTVMTNLVAGLAQCESAMELFYRQGFGHLVVMSSVTAARGMPGPMNAYAASKVALAHIAEGIRFDVAESKLPIRVSTLRPGYIDSEMHARTGRRHPLLVDGDIGARALVRAIENEVTDACVPWWPWQAFSLVLKYAPKSIVRRII